MCRVIRCIERERGRCWMCSCWAWSARRAAACRWLTPQRRSALLIQFLRKLFINAQHRYLTRDQLHRTRPFLHATRRGTTFSPSSSSQAPRFQFSLNSTTDLPILNGFQNARSPIFRPQVASEQRCLGGNVASIDNRWHVGREIATKTFLTAPLPPPRSSML